MPTTFFWDEQILEPIEPHITYLREQYLEAVGYEAFFAKREAEWEQEEQAQYEEFMRLESDTDNEDLD